MTLQEMRERKKSLGYTNEMIAEKTGVPLGTVQKIFAGITKAPRWDTMRAIESLLTEKEDRQAWIEGLLREIKTSSYTVLHRTDLLHEEAVRYGEDPKQGHYTIEDYYKLPDDRRVELIDGYIYDMASALPVHQAILGELFVRLYACVENHPECELFIAPSDVRIDNDDNTVVQPDLYIFCNRRENSKKIISGAPGFITEILSPSSRYNDLFRKLNKYRNAGVREYWIVDPEHLKVTVYDLEHDALPETYTFSDTVPVGISEGTCRIDFSGIYERVKRYL